VPKLPRHCPGCNGSLMVTRLTCPNCGTEVTGSFQPDLFSHLASNDFDFVVLFVKSRGNVKEMERELGISYWSVQAKDVRCPREERIEHDTRMTRFH
jgi:hypothetical protein